MSALQEYNEKRNFNKTPEPEGKTVEPEEKNRFVVQKHMARREHYDFRLQVGDVLVSWAVPKKPVYDTSVRRLAIKVEDHPLDYIHFEGNIPKGNYGAGTVMVWDVGYYYLDDRKIFPTNGEMKKRIARGSLKLYLQGAKLQGLFNLVKAGKNDKEEWFLMKAKETITRDKDEEISALTGRTMEEIASSTVTWNSEKAQTEKKEETIKQPVKLSKSNQVSKAEFPGFVEPMLATLTDKAFSKNDWIYELKLDGYRVVSAKDNGQAELYSRRGHSFTERYHLIAKELSGIKARFVLDGEVCYMEEGQRASFQKLQHQDHEQEKLHYYVFDLLWLNGHDLKSLPLLERKKLLQVLLGNPPEHIHYLDHIETKGEAFFEKIENQELEGIIAKRAESSYYPNDRSKDWLKIKTGYRQEMVICGYMKSDKENRPFSSLLCAVYEDDAFVYTGRVGTGFNDESLKNIREKMDKLETDQPPVKNPPSDKNIQWIKPELLCEVKFSNWTKDRIMRHPSFMGLRMDKKPSDIRVEKPVKQLPSVSNVKFSNLSKVFWPDEGFTKRDVIDYYHEVSETILPYLKDRPQSLYRTPNGIKEKGFFQKNMRGVAPNWVSTTEVSRSEKDPIEYLICQDKETLLYMANLGCIEINPWSSSLPKLDNPDFMIFDLDPVEVEFANVVQLASEFKKLFDQLDMPAFCKTSGSRGLHIYVPVKQEYTYSQVQNFVKIIAGHIHKQNKEITSFERSPSARKGKIYLDYLQNGRGKTMAAVYSLRPRPGAMVSAPLKWEELTPDLTPEQFNIQTMPGRIEKYGDLWNGIFEQRVDMQKVLKKMEG